jgi:hypothetical protein
LAYLSGKRERGFNYAIWDFDYVDEIVRRKTKDGKILEDTAETVYRRKPKVEIRTDNPGGQWLESQRRRAEETGNLGDVTGYLKDHKPVMINPLRLKNIPGAMGEEATRGSGAKAHDIMQWMGREEMRSPIFIAVDYKGRPKIMEGNNRMAVAAAMGIERVPVEVRWFAGGEQVDGPFSPENLQKLVDE